MDSEVRRISTSGAAFHVLLVALVAVFASLVAAPDSETGRSITSVLLAVSLGAALWVASRSRRLLGAGFVLLLASALGWFSDPLGLPANLGPVGPALSSVYLLTAAWVLAARVSVVRVVTGDTLVGTVCIYLLLALAFACAYLGLARLDPGAFSERAAGGRELADFAYLSLVTMTTLGYGDISPVSGPARALAVVQSVTGVLYTSIAVARIVAVHAGGGEAPVRAAALPWRRRRLRNLFLLLLLLVPLPIAADEWATSAVHRALSVALLLAAFYGLGDRRVVLLLGGPVLLALIVRAWGTAPGSTPSLLANTVEICVFGAGIALVARQAVLREEVDREVLYGAGALYLLLGVWVAAAFGLAEAANPGSLSPSGTHSSGALLYLSFMTVTTTGYGDMLPTSRATELIAGVGACLGIFYPAILVARLVSLGSRDVQS